MKRVIKSNASNFFQVSSDVYKHLAKLIGTEKSPEVKVYVVKCLRAFVQSTLNYSGMHQHFEQVLQVAIKGFEDPVPEIIEEFILVCY